MEAELDEEVPLQSLRRGDADPALAEPGIDRKAADGGDPRATVDELPRHRPHGLAVGLDHEDAEAVGLALRAGDPLRDRLGFDARETARKGSTSACAASAARNGTSSSVARLEETSMPPR